MEQEQITCPLSKGERILVAVDGSECSEKAVDQALSMGKICGSSLFAVSVIEMYPESLGVAYQVEEKMEKEVRRTLEAVKERAARENIRCETIVHMGARPDEFIVQEARDKKVDLIVLGTHGRTGLKKLLMGSVAERVIGHAPCAVLVTPP